MRKSTWCANSMWSAALPLHFWIQNVGVLHFPGFLACRFGFMLGDSSASSPADAGIGSTDGTWNLQLGLTLKEKAPACFWKGQALRKVASRKPHMSCFGLVDAEGHAVASLLLLRGHREVQARRASNWYCYQCSLSALNLHDFWCHDFVCVCVCACKLLVTCSMYNFFELTSLNAQ